MQSWQGSWLVLKPCFKSLKNSILWTDHIAVSFLRLLARRGRCETEDHVSMSRMCQLWNMSWYILHYVWRLETLPPRIIWWEKHITQACVFLGFSYLLRVKPQRAARHPFKLTGTVSTYCIHKARASGGTSENSLKISKLTNNQDNTYLKLWGLLQDGAGEPLFDVFVWVLNDQFLLYVNFNPLYSSDSLSYEIQVKQSRPIYRKKHGHWDCYLRWR